jgi:hypothetical protein
MHLFSEKYCIYFPAAYGSKATLHKNQGNCWFKERWGGGEGGQKLNVQRQFLKVNTENSKYGVQNLKSVFKYVR